MKIRKFAIAATLAGLLGLSGGRVYAQPTETLQVHVAFDFRVGHKVLPAGTYDLSYDASEPVLFVRSVDGHHNAVVLTERTITNAPQPDARLVFDHDRSGYVLSKVFGPEETIGLQVPGRPALG
jgi:hypothetical protein